MSSIRESSVEIKQITVVAYEGEVCRTYNEAVEALCSYVLEFTRSCPPTSRPYDLWVEINCYYRTELELIKEAFGIPED